MTDIDPTSDIEVNTVSEHVMVRVPLAGSVTEEWLRLYQRIARSTGVPAEAQGQPEQAWIVVRVPATATSKEVAATLDAARSIISEADAAQRGPASTEVEGVVHGWWARTRKAAPRKPISKVKVVRAGFGVERRWPLIAALALIIALPLLLPSRFSLGPKWIVPTIDAVLLVAIVIAYRVSGVRHSTVVRMLSFALVVVFIVEAVGITIRLLTDIVEGGPETNSPTKLLGVGFGVWFYTILTFAFVYWVLDGGGPDARLWAPPDYPDLAFPEQLNPVVSPPGWRPQFFDYLYLGFTNATAFSPTDVMPLARWAKAAMSTQAAGSLLVLGLVVARAVNILK